MKPKCTKLKVEDSLFKGSGPGPLKSRIGRDGMGRHIMGLCRAKKPFLVEIPETSSLKTVRASSFRSFGQQYYLCTCMCFAAERFSL